jgi:hypothetical protein
MVISMRQGQWRCWTAGIVLVMAVMAHSGCRRSEASVYEAHLAATVSPSRTLATAPPPPRALASVESDPR